MNISLPPAMAEFVRRQVNANYGNASEFFRQLVRERMQREIDADLAFLERTGEGAKAGPTEKQVQRVLAIQRRVRTARHARRV